MDDLYRENILDHYKHPRNFGSLSKPTISATDNVVSCGDSLSMSLKIQADKVTQAKFSGTGCAISMASASMLTEKIIGQKITTLQSLTRDDILNMLGISLTPTRLKCALLGLEVLHKALYNYKHGKI